MLGRSRLGVKVQDGCNNRCSYCIVWKARGPERSVPVASVLEQVRRAERAGIPEVVLTGVNLGAYDGIDASDSHVEIDELLDKRFDGSLPAFVAAFTKSSHVSDKELDEVQKMIDLYRKENHHG